MFYGEIRDIGLREKPDARRFDEKALEAEFHYEMPGGPPRYNRAELARRRELRKAVIDTVRRDLGPVAVIGELNFVGMLPKTRSGKLMRRVLKAVILDRDPGDITTIEDEGSVEEARQAWIQMKGELERGHV